MEEIIVAPNVISFLNDLVETLFEKEYFAFKESAHEYVDWLERSIYAELPTQIHCTSPETLKHYGRYYIKIKSNDRTMWYVFFDKKDGRFFVEFITNNHTPQGANLNKL